MTKPRSDEPVSPAGFVVAIVTIMILGLLVIGGDARYLGVFWLIIVGLTWAPSWRLWS
jgi:hypothetical protein